MVALRFKWALQVMTQLRWIALVLGLLLSLAANTLTWGQELTVSVLRYEVTGNTLLSDQQIQSVTQSRTGQVKLQDIQATAQALQSFYRDLGFGAVVVQLPEQTLLDGVVRLDVIEGRLSSIEVAGNVEFSRENVLRGFPSLKRNTTPNLHALDTELLMVNENPAKQVRVVFQPGENKGDVEALAVVAEQALTTWQISLDNTGNDSTGNYRSALFYQHANVGDTDSVLGLRLITSPTQPDQVGILSLSLNRPLYKAQTSLEFNALASNTVNSPNQTAFGEMRFTGQGYSLGARLIKNLPQLQEFKKQVSAGIETRSYINNCSIGDLGSLACGTAAAPVQVLPFTVSYNLNQIGRQQHSVQWVHNILYNNSGSDELFNAARNLAVSRYDILKANTTQTLDLPKAWALTLHAEGQYTEQALVSAEQFGLGGSRSVRGYAERALSGDFGYQVSAELRHPLNTWFPKLRKDETLSAALFVEGGEVNYLKGYECATGRTQCSAWGLGLGLVWAKPKAYTFKIDLARAGQTVSTTAAGSWRAHFSFSYTL